jgi:microtubule-associated protein-like 6
LFGTRRSEIVEIKPPFEKGRKIEAKLLMQGHYHEELWGLAVHPNQLTFFTCGEDELLAAWDVKNKRIIRCVENGYASITIDIAPNGKFLAVGCVNGRIRIYDPMNLKRLNASGKNEGVEIAEVIDPDKLVVSLVKFSPKSDYLAVCYSPPYNMIVFYSTKNWKRVS